MSDINPKFLDKAQKVVRKYEAVIDCAGESVTKLEYKVPFKTFKVFMINDAHLGSKETDLKLMKDYIDLIKKTPNALVIINGDLLDNALKNSKSDVYDAALQPSEQVMAAIALLYDIRKKIAVISRGNHEYRTDKDTGLNPLQAVNPVLEAENKYASESFNLTITNNANESVYIYGSHGSGLGGIAETSIMDNAVRIVNDKVDYFDWYVFAHKHISGNYELVKKIYDEKGKSKDIIQRVTIEPAWLNYGGYAAMYNYKTPPTTHHYFEWSFVNGRPSLTVHDFVPSYLKTVEVSKTAYQKEIEKESKKNEKTTGGRK